MYIFFIVLVVCEQGVCNVVKRLRFAGAVQLNNFTYGSVQNDCSLSYSHESRVPVNKRAFWHKCKITDPFIARVKNWVVMGVQQ